MVLGTSIGPVAADEDQSIGPAFTNDAQQADWRQYRGSADHRGWNQVESTLSVSNVSQLRILWRAGGGFNSSPAVANGVVYNGDAGPSAYSPDCASGGAYCSPLWHGNAGYPDWASPAIGAGMVFMQSVHGLYAYRVGCRADGGSCEPVWTGTDASAAYSSPAYANGMLFLGTQFGELQAYDVNACANAGGPCAPTWTAPLAGEPQSSPAVSKGIVYIAGPDAFLYAYGARCATGGGTCSPIWKADIHAQTSSSPAVANGVVYIPNRSGEVLAFAVGCASSGNTCQPIWTGVTGGYIHASPAVTDDMLYIASGRRLFAFAVGCGSNGSVCQPVWRSSKSGVGGMIAASPAVANGVVYVGTQGKFQGTGRLVAYNAECLDADAVCAPIFRSRLLGGMVNSSPAVSHGQVYIASNGGTFYAFGLPATP
ncbi:MAG TPA: PQQ-binding-like beta-propeller repeat protein [Candidatus Limnocylindrales bacterium]|nr:PQQ-binding-like beta-propeller repeat protein [Candidatus Limnocylindrales bacterium]